MTTTPSYPQLLHNHIFIPTTSSYPQLLHTHNSSITTTPSYPQLLHTPKAQTKPKMKKVGQLLYGLAVTGAKVAPEATLSAAAAKPLLTARCNIFGANSTRCISNTTPKPLATTATSCNMAQPLNQEPVYGSSHVVYKGNGGGMSLEHGLAMPQVLTSTDVVLRVLKTTICGTDIHILKGNVASCQAKTRLGHEGIGEVIEKGGAVDNLSLGDRVLINTTTQCGKCANCQRQFFGHCDDGGWQLGHTIDGMQGTHVRVPHADFSTQKIPRDLWDTEIEDGLVMCSDILPTGFEVGLLDGDIKKGMSVAIVGMGPVGLASLITSSLFPPSDVFVIDVNDHRLQTSQELVDATRGLEDTRLHVVDNNSGSAVEQVMEATRGKGVDLVVEAIGTPTGWYICQDIVKAGGHIAMLGVHGKSATINLERMWYRNFRFSAGLVHGYSIPTLMKMVMDGSIPANKLISHRLPMSQVEHAYDLFENAAKHNTLKVILENDM